MSKHPVRIYKEQMEKDGGFEETEEHIELLEGFYPAYVGEDRNSEEQFDEDREYDEEQYEMVFEDKIQEAGDLLYNHPESFAEIVEELRQEDREYDFDFAKVLMDSLKELPSSSEETNVIRSHSLILKIAKAYEDFIDAYAETLTRKELGG